MNGEEGRLALLVALFDEFTNRTTSKDPQKIALLQDELQATLRRPNSISIICQAIESGSRQQLLQQLRMLPENFLEYISLTASLSPLQSAAFALGASQSQFPHVATDAKRFLRARLPEITQINPSDISEELIPTLMHEFATPEISGNFINALKSIQSPSLPGNSPLINSNPQLPSSRISIARILIEKGPSWTANHEVFRSVIVELGVKLTEDQLSEIITSFVVRSLQTVTSEDGKTTEQYIGQFNLEVVAEVLQRECRAIEGLNWTLVVQGFDQPGFNVRSETLFQLLVRLFIRISGVPLPAAGLLGQWTNRNSQLALLILAASSHHNIVDFTALISSEQKIIGDIPTPPNFSWLALPLYTTLLQLASLGLTSEVLEALTAAASQYPEYVLVCISQVTDPSNVVRAEILRRTLPLFTGLTGSRPTSFAVMKKLSTVNPDLLVLLFRIGLKRATTVQDIQDIDAHLSNMGTNIIKQLEMEGSIEEFLGFWCIKADRSDFNLEEKLASLLENNPQYSRIFVNFAKTHVGMLRPRSADGGLLSFESFAALIRSSQNFSQIVPIDELRSLVAVYQSSLSQHQNRVASGSGVASAMGGGVSENSGVPGPSSSVPMGVNPNAVGGTSEESISPRHGPQADEVEEEANAYFQKIYSSDISVPEIINLLRRFKSSSEKRETEIFRCMIHNLFDEVRFFHKYPEKELQVTGVLFGTLIQHQLVSSITLGMALRYVLEALRKDPEQDLGGSNEKMFRFGKIAIEQFRTRLHEWPQYCSHLVQIPHLVKHSPDIFNDAQRVISSPQTGAQGAPIHEKNQTSPLTTAPSTPGPMIENLSSRITGLNLNSTDTSGSNLGGGGASGSIAIPPEDLNQPQVALNLKSSDEMSRMLTVNVEVPIRVMPPENVRDQIHFIINNLAKDNLETKSTELKSLLVPDYNPWFANYLVVKRVSNQPNFHKIYLQAVLKVDASDLMNIILESTYHNVTKLLQGPHITQSTVERSLLRNLGIWLGLITLARNKPILDRRINIKELLFWGYERGRLIAVCSFVAKILEGCKESKVFRSPNPWLMAVLGVMKEFYSFDDLKTNIKFEVQVLCRNLGIKIEDIQKTSCLAQYRPPLKDVSNPDFTFKSNGPNNNASASNNNLPPPSPTIEPSAVSETSQPPPSPSLLPLVQPQTQSQVQPQSLPPPIVQPSPPTPHVQPPLQVQPTTSSTETVIPNLSSYIIINPSLQFFTSNPAQRRLVSIAIDRAIREIIQPVVERSVMIASVTTRQLILKDFAAEGNEQSLRNSAHMMVSNLAGSLALVTCKEPLRLSICNHLRSLLTQTVQDQPLIDQIVQVCSHDNLDLGSMLIEKAAMEKSIREVDDTLNSAYQNRRKHRENEQPFFDPAFGSSSVGSPPGSPRSSSKFPKELPDALKSCIGGLSPQQLSVYEAFQRNTPSPALLQQQQTSSIPSQTTPIQPLQQPVQPTNIVGTTPSLAQPQPASLTMSQAIDSFQQVLTRIDHFFRTLQIQGRELTLTMITSSSSPADQEIITLSREIVAITQRTQVDVRNETALTIGETVFKNLMDSVNVDVILRVEILVTILEALRDIINSGVKRISPEVVASWLESHTNINSQEEVCRKMHRLILSMLLRSKLLRSQEIDGYFASHMDMGREISWVEMALTFVRHCLNDNLALTHEFPRIFDTVSKMRPANSMIKKQLQRFLLELRQLSAAKDDSKNQGANLASVQTPSAIPPSGPARLEGAPPRDIVTFLLEQWLKIWPSSNDQIFNKYLQSLQQYGVLKSEEAADRFFKMATELCVEACLRSATQSTSTSTAPSPASDSTSSATLTYNVIDALSKLFLLLIRLADKESGDTSVRANLLGRILQAIVMSLIDDHNNDLKTQQQLLIQHQQTKQTTPLSKPAFDQRPYFRILCNLTQDLMGVPDPKVEGNPALYPVLHTYYLVYMTIQPSTVPGFAFAWLQLISHRSFMPNLLAKGQKGWPLLQRLLVTLLNFLAPFLKNNQLNDSTRKLYKGTLRMMLVLLHDFPEFLCDYHISLCDAIPQTCVQMRNLVLSAFPRSMRFPDPFTPNLKVDLLPEISQPPRLLAESFTILSERGIRQHIDAYMTSRSHPELPSHLPSAMLNNGSLNLPLLNATVAYVGTLGAGQPQNKTGHSPAIDIFKGLLAAFDAEGRYSLFNSMGNQLRYPNSHTHYFSYLLLLLFAEAESESVQDQITRVLLERLIAHKPHPWGLLITFIELIKNPRYSFWHKNFTSCSPQIKQVFDSVARSCLGTSGAASLIGSNPTSGSTPTATISAPSTPSGQPPMSSPHIPSSAGSGVGVGTGVILGVSSNGSWLK